MKSKTEVTYWLKIPGDESGMETDVLKTITSKVPEVGEIIHIDTTSDLFGESIYNKLPDMPKENVDMFLPKKEQRVKGDFVVHSVKRWIKVYYGSQELEGLSAQLSTLSTKTVTKVPCGYEVENFEVFIQPFQHSELTETPIAKLRNLLGPMAGYFQMLEIVNEMGENDDKKAEMHVLLNKAAKQSSDTMDKILELVKDQKIWR